MSTKGDINAQLTLFTQQLKRRQIRGSKDGALATANMLKRFIKARKWESPEAMIEEVRRVGARLEAAQPFEFAIGNIVRRILKSIRTIDDAYHPEDTAEETEVLPRAGSVQPEDEKSAAMFSLLSIGDVDGGEQSASNDGSGTAGGRSNGESGSGKSKKSSNRKTESPEMRDRRDAVVNEIDQLIDEITNDDPLFKYGVDMFNMDEVVLAPCLQEGSVLDFLVRVAAKKPRLSVVVTESYPNGVSEARAAVKKLRASGIRATLIPDSTVYAVMVKVSKVVVGASAVLANGGCVASCGAAMACHAAKQFRRPVLVVAGSYKLSTRYPYDPRSLIEIGNSGRIIDYAHAELMDKLEVLNPLHDYIAPELIDIVITSDCAALPSYMYRIVMDNYSTSDHELQVVG